MDILSITSFIEKEDVNYEILTFTLNQRCLAVYILLTQNNTFSLSELSVTLIEKEASFIVQH